MTIIETCTGECECGGEEHVRCKSREPKENWRYIVQQIHPVRIRGSPPEKRSGENVHDNRYDEPSDRKAAIDNRESVAEDDLWVIGEYTMDDRLSPAFQRVRVNDGGEDGENAWDEENLFGKVGAEDGEDDNGDLTPAKDV
ncbi:hypothetical protein FRC18_008496 [Serendipita sp. 400]|nr:hypothetical protein FRC18_008496 [Serendipita sp. 400]